MKGLRWLSVIAPVVAVAIIEIVSDGLLDSLFPFPLDTIVVVALVAVLAWVFSSLAFRRIDGLSEELRGRNSDLERREASARALHRVSVAIAALDDLGEILRTVVDQARDLLGVDVALLLTSAPDGEDHVAAVSGPPDSVDEAGGFPGTDIERFVRPDLAVARIDAPLQRAGQTIGRLMVGSRHERGFESTSSRPCRRSRIRPPSRSRTPDSTARLRELAVVAERERIAREMHDGLAQVLGYVNMKTPGDRGAPGRGSYGRRTDPARASLRRPRGASTSTSARRSLGCAARSYPGLVWWPRSRTTRSGSPRHRRSSSRSSLRTTRASWSSRPTSRRRRSGSCRRP